jgi:hypothetical protein
MESRLRLVRLFPKRQDQDRLHDILRPRGICERPCHVIASHDQDVLVYRLRRVGCGGIVDVGTGLAPGGVDIPGCDADWISLHR